MIIYLLGLTLGMGLALSAQADNRLGGISTRSFVQTDSTNYMIAGVLITGSSKRIVVRASSVDGVLNPLLQVQSFPDGNLLYSNDNWATDPSAAELQQTGWTPAGASDAAMIITLSPGLYTMQVSPVDKPGVGLIEVYELSSTESPKLGGISTRSFVQTNSMNYMIAGLFISGSAKRVVVRASGVVDGMLDPILEVQSYPDGNLLYSNDNWGTDPSAVELQQLGWSPARGLDAAMIVTLQPGLYTMQVSPKLNPGIGLIEVYELPDNTIIDESPVVEEPNNCLISEPTNCPNLDNIPAPPEDADIYLGMGLDSDREWLKQSVCINGTPEQITASKAELSTSLIYNHTTLLKSLEIDGKADVSIKGIFNIHAEAEYEKIVKKRDYAQAFILEYDVKLGTQSYRLDTVNPLNYTGLSAIDGGACYFRQICGDQYVHQVKHGGTVRVEMDFQFTERFHKKEFNASFEAGLDKTFKICTECGEKILPFSISLEASINKLSKTTRDSGSLTITASQTGGYAENLINVIGTNTMTCSLNNIQECKKVLDDVVTYVQNDFAPSVRDLPAVYGYTLFPYEQILGVPKLISDVTPEIEQARLDLATEYEQRLVDLDRVRELLQYRLSPERKQRMEYLQSALEQDIENLSKAGIGCFSNLGNCLADKCEVFNSLVSYDPKELEFKLVDGLIAYYPFTPKSQSDLVINSTSPFIGAELYQHSKFRGIVQLINGYHSSLPYMENSASSAKVHMGCTLTLYKDVNYGRPILQLGHGHHPKFSSSVNDETSSAKLDCPTTTRATPNGTILDMSGNDNHAVIYGTNGLADGEYSFPYGNFIDVPGNINPSFLTLSAWINPADATRSVIIDKVSNTGGGSEQYALNLLDGKPAINVKKDGGWHWVIASTNVALNEWSLITGTWDGFSLKIYVNGVLKGSNQNIPVGGLDQLGSGSTRIGMWWHEDPQFFNGKMDDIRIYERALSDTDVLKLYNEGTGNPPVTIDDKTQLVTAAYCSILDREADEGGLNNFVNLITNEGWTAKQLVQTLLNSEEFKQNFFDTKSTTEYVTYMYNFLLQREPDPDGLTAWVNNVEQQGWSIIIEGFLNNEEYIQNFGDESIPMKDGC